MLRGKLGKASLNVGRRIGEALVWTYENPGKAASAYALAIMGLFAAAFALRPDVALADEANPNPLEFLAGIVVGPVDAMGGALADLASEAVGIDGMLRGFIDTALGMSQVMIANAATGNLVNVTFDQLLGDGDFADIVESAHTLVAIPLAQIVMAIVFVVGLVKIVGRISANEGGVDTWQLVWVFVMYGIATAIITASWDIMQFFYQLSQAGIAELASSFELGDGVELANVSEDIKNTGVLLFMAVMTVVIFGVTFVVCIVSYLVVVARAIQIYLYTAFAPIPLAFMVSEGGRQMTLSFVRKYAAVLLSGLILVVVYILFANAVATLATPAADSVMELDSLAEWAVGYMMALGVYIAFAWAFFQSGGWARDIVGA